MGEACTACRGHCVDPPTPEEPLCVELPDGETLQITECPNRWCGENAKLAVRLARFAEEGCLPVSGGVLDQSHQFMTATYFIWSVQEEIRAERNKHGQH